MAEDKTPAAEEPKVEPKVEVKTESDPNAEILKLIHDAKAKVDAQVEDEKKTGKSDPLDDATVKRIIAEIMKTQKLIEKDNARAEMDKPADVPKSERKGEFIENKAGGPKLSYKAMLERPALDEESKYIQDLNDDVQLLSVLTGRDPRAFVSEKARGMTGELKYRASKWQEEKANALYATGTDVGDEWVPTLWSNELYKYIQLFGVVEPQFPYVDMPSNPYTSPVQEALPTAYLAGEPTDAAPTNLVASTPTTGNQTYTAKTFAVRVPYSYEFDEDAIIAALPQLKEGCAEAIAYGRETAIVNGQATSAIDLEIGGGAIASNDARKAFDGLRYLALLVEDENGSTTKQTVSGANLTYTLMSRAKAKMRKYAANPSKLRWFVGPALLEQIMRFDDVRTIDKFGPNATIVKGEMARIGGVSILPTEVMNESQNAAGVYDDSTKTQCSALLVNVSCFRVGRRRELTVETAKNIETQQKVVVATARMAFRTPYDCINAAHGHTPLGLLYYILTDSTT